MDRYAMDFLGVAPDVLMERAGEAAARVLEALFPRGAVVVVVGGGNNGGDGVVLGRCLHAAGRPVRILVLGDRPAPDPLLHDHPVPSGPAPDDPSALEGILAEAGAIVDGLLGTGIRGAPREPQAALIRAINAAPAPVLSLDVPSGVDADTGAARGEAVRAAATVAFGAPKLGTLLFPGRELTGRLMAVDIGFPPWEPGMAGARLITPGWASDRRPRRSLVTHKNAEGRLLILAGRPGMAGAAVLAARGALRAGAGFVRVASAPENRVVIQGAVPEAVFVDSSDTGALLEAAGESDALAAGPGWGTGPEEARTLDRLLAEAAPPGILLDADGLTLLGGGMLEAFSGAGRSGRRLLTPHPGEMARLGGSRESIERDPMGAARQGAGRWEAAILLKGTPSLVASPPGGSGAPDGGPVLIASAGSSDLARAGMGDVLTGVAGAFLARGASATDAAGLALHLTGRAGALAALGESLLPSDVAEYLSLALAEEGDGVTDLDLSELLLDLDPPR
jgi:ADP-dependent NAD(P)H-hydrate dehydratase / NAD(P)H-hydrate epimerase